VRTARRAASLAEQLAAALAQLPPQLARQVPPLPPITRVLVRA